MSLNKNRHVLDEMWDNEIDMETDEDSESEDEERQDDDNDDSDEAWLPLLCSQIKHAASSVISCILCILCTKTIIINKFILNMCLCVCDLMLYSLSYINKVIKIFLSFAAGHSKTHRSWKFYRSG